MLSRAMRRHRADNVEHMVVELKAPSVTIGTREITQTKEYAFAVSKDERFHTIKDLRWHFWVVSNVLNDYAREEIAGGPDPQRNLIHKKNNITVGVKTWAEIIEENKARLQFFQEALEYRVGEAEAIAHLQERHSKLLEGVFDEVEGTLKEGLEEEPGLFTSE